MTPERWRQIKEIFHGAVELPPEERPPFLDSSCPHDTALRAEVEDLLAGDEAERSWFSRPASEAVPELLASPPSPSRIGRRLGSHRIVRELGSGGMGTVYLARRADGEYQKQVAVKVVRRGMDSDAILARFRRERQILANLDHPNVARLLDGGMTDDGLPFLVMEYIEGTPIREYCDTHRLSVRQRIELFLGVLGAVEAAHRNLVIHRDLKPANILVTAQGTPKLLDFGVAKLLDPAAAGETAAGETATDETATDETATDETATDETATDETAHGPAKDRAGVHGATVTRQEQRWLTPQYASPEQVQGRPITTASDVYALGVVLYELLTGRLPYRFEASSLSEIERVVCLEEPPKPSQDVAPEAPARFSEASAARLCRRLSGDLDTIVRKALRKEPERRYGSAEHLAEDLRRHLAGLPVRARRDTVGYRTGKFLRRHWLGALALSLVVVSLLIGLLVAAGQAKAARQQQWRAERISDFMEELFRAPDPRQARGRPVLARDLLNRAAPKMRREFQDLPELRADLLTTMGVSYLYLGDYEEAESSLEEARRLRERFSAPSVEQAETLTWLGLLRYYQDRLDEAERRLREGSDLRRRFLGPASRELAENLNHLGLVRSARGDLDGAERFHRRALALRRQVLEDGDLDLAYSLNNLGMVLKARSLRLRGRAAELRRELDRAPAPHLLHALAHAALAAGARLFLERATEFLEEALELRERAFRSDHPETATSLDNLAGVVVAAGDHDRAESLYLEALRIREKVLDPDHPDLALSYNNLGGLFHRTARYPQAERWFARALDLYRETLGGEHKSTATMARNLASAVVRQRRYEEAEALFRDALAATRGAWGEDHPKVAEILEPLAQILAILGKDEEARDLRRRAHTSRRGRLARPAEPGAATPAGE